MKSKLNISEFRNRIEENFKIGSPKLKLSPFGVFSMFGGISKTFYGNFDESTFRFTMNSTISPTFYIIKGKYKNTNNTLNVNWIFRCKGRHDSATKCTTIPLQSTPPIPLESTPLIPLQRSPLIPEQSTPLFS